MPITLDEATHVYTRADGSRLPSVTSILRPLIDLSGIPPDTLEAKRDLGKRVHAACHYLSENDLDPESVESDVEPYLSGFSLFLLQSNARIVANEKIVHSDAHGYAGQLDLIVDIPQPGRTAATRWLIDIKSCIAVPMSAGPQTAAYHRALGDPAVTRRGALRLTPDGKMPRLEPLDDPNDWAVFMACLTIHRFKEAHA